MVFEHRSSAAVVHRAPPLPIITNGTQNSRRSSSCARPSTNGRLHRANRASNGSIPSHLSPNSTPYSSSLTNASPHNRHQTPANASQPARSGRAASPSASRPATSTTSNSKSLRPLTIDEYERDYRLAASDLELTERVFRGGMASNQLRSALWPYLFGLVKQRGRFTRRASSGYGGGAQHVDHIYIEHEDNLRRWRELDRLYRTYENQWKSIQPDQELRFSSFRERKSLIERDVVRSDRTHPFYSSHNENYADNLANLTKVLMSYMMYDFDIGYLQGMSDLAAPILYVFQGDVVKSFWVFVEVMKLFRRNFEFSQKTIHFQLNCLYRLIKLTDGKLATYLREADCSNCFFVFRHIVCQFKRELMRANDSQSSTPAESSGSNAEDLDTSTESASGTSTIKEAPNRTKRDDYANVLNLWDTIWFVQRRHELRAESKCVHTYKIATTTNGKSGAKEFAGAGNGTRCCCCCKHRRQNHCYKPNHQINHCNSNNNNHLKNNNNNHQQQKTYHQLNGSPLNRSDGVSSTTKSTTTTTTTSTYLNNGHLAARKTSTASSNISLASTTTDSSISSSTSSSSAASSGSPSSLPQKSPCCTSCMGPENLATPRVKQAQVVYTKETFYSSFDPNQADIPRFELTETEKFVISLCLSLIRRERNYILNNRLDASEIHQHFIRPRLASDLSQFLEQAYEIYHFLNHECDLQTLVKGASEFAAPGEYSPIVPSQAIAAGANRATAMSAAANAAGTGQLSAAAGTGAEDQASSSSAATDTYDLLKDYFIISPTAYSISMNSPNQSDTLSPMSLSSGHQMAARRKASSGALLGPSLHNNRSSWDHHFVNSTPPGSMAAMSIQTPNRY